ncbi:MAG TPA: F0F1 ATP synthase subunit A [Solirubrobacteraceae bacterium]|jgi:F-type H+-transporting ATPase subunit a|nr:F0F1 ATP synthase subunit A [Solirubrobacteraceae bacterium]
MSAVAHAASPSAGSGGGAVEPGPRKPGSVKRTLLTIGGVYLAGVIVLVAIYGWSPARNKAFEPQNEFKLDNWVTINLGGINFSITKAVLYLVIAAVLTCVSMIYIARRMQQRPNKVQTAVEVIFRLMQENITGSSMDEQMAAKWFPFVGALFLFILFSNLIGYIPLPTNTEHEIAVFGWHIPSFSIYAATANLSIPLALALVVFVSYTVEGVRAKGPIGYLKGLVPAGVTGAMAGAIFALEVLSNLMRLLSLSIRLFANILAGHLIILFMSGALAVLLGIAALGWITIPFGIVLFAFEVGLVAALQAFIFATLTAIYLGGAVADHH